VVGSGAAFSGFADAIVEQKTFLTVQRSDGALFDRVAAECTYERGVRRDDAARHERGGGKRERTEGLTRGPENW
jgi:hypothetical protein